MFRILSILIFIAGIALLVWRLRSPANRREIFLSWRFSGASLRSVQGLRDMSYALTFVLFVLLAISGFLPNMIVGVQLTGFPLLLHVAIAPLFAVLLAALVVLAAHRHRFVSNDWSALRAILGKKSGKKNDPAGVYPTALQKVCFWLAAIASLPMIASILFSMSTLFSAESQLVFLNVHRYSALLFFVVVILHTYLLLQAEHEPAEKASPNVEE